MLFSSIFKSSALLRVFGSIVFLIFISCDIKQNVQTGVGFSFDFEKFLKELEAKVYNSKLKRDDTLVNQGNKRELKFVSKDYRKRFTKNLQKTQRGSLEDALMMKLVSYYEEKYKLSHTQTTTEPAYFFEQITPISRDMLEETEATTEVTHEVRTSPSYYDDSKNLPVQMSYYDAIPEVGII